LTSFRGAASKCVGGFPEPVKDSSHSVVIHYASFLTSCADSPGLVSAALVSLNAADGSIRWTSNFSVDAQTRALLYLSLTTRCSTARNDDATVNGSIYFYDTASGALSFNVSLGIPALPSATLELFRLEITQRFLSSRQRALGSTLALALSVVMLRIAMLATRLAQFFGATSGTTVCTLRMPP